MENGVERTKLNNTEDPNTEEDSVLGLNKLPGPGESDRNTIHATQA